MRRTLAIGLLPFITAACMVESPPPAKPRAANPSAPAPAAASSDLAARADGVGSIGFNFEVSKEALARAFPCCQVEWVSIDQGGDLREEYWAVKQGGKLALRVLAYDTSLRGIDVVSPDVPTPFNVKIGATHAEVAKALGSLDCENAGDDTDWRSDIAVCTASSGPDFYTFDFELDGTQAEELLADPAKLAQTRLVAISWQAWLARGDRPF